MQNHNISNFQEYCDIVATPWGAPGDNKVRASLSFWIGSNKIKPDLTMLKHNTVFQDHVTKMKVKVVVHRLHETTSKAVGFFLGKSPQHTNRRDLEKRFELLWKEKKPNEPMPSVQVKAAKIKGTDNSTDAITLFAGAKDLDRVTEFMDGHTMPTFIKYSIKKSNKEDFDNQIQLNNAIQANSRAVKVTKATEQLRQWLIQELTVTHSKDIFDVTLASNQTFLYVQCDSEKKDEVTAAVTELITRWITINPYETPDDHPQVVTRAPNEQDTLPDDQTEDTRNTLLTSLRLEDRPR